MPIYEYECNTCGVHFERRQSFNDTRLPDCPNGHHGTHRVYSAPGIVFKGSGWYVTDSRSKGKKTSDH
ncbi:MAG: FmdB family zinc ribbon protein [Anaerolineae bacterium]|jgi:putative FmdB family regulatory protein